MISAELQVALHNSFVGAREKHHKWITVEHLLLHLMDAPDVQERLRSREVDETGLGRDLEHQVSQTETFLANEEVDTQPTAPFQKVIQYAIVMVQKASRKEVTPVDILRVVVAHPECLAPKSSVQLRIASFKWQAE